MKCYLQTLTNKNAIGNDLFFEKWEINIIPPRFSCNSLRFKSDSRCWGLDANHRKGETERVEIKNEDDKRRRKKKKKRRGRRWRWRRWARKGSQRGAEGKTVYIFVRDTPSPHRFSLGSPFLARFFFKHRPHNTYTWREHECVRATRTRAGERSPRLNYRLYVFKWSAVCIFIKARERRGLHHSPRPLRMPISRTAPPPRSPAIAFPSVAPDSHPLVPLSRWLFVPVCIRVYVDSLLFP